MKLEEEATCIAEDRSHLIAPPEWCGGRSAILTYWLQIPRLAVSKSRHNFQDNEWEGLKEKRECRQQR